MTEFNVEVLELNSFEKHPNADTLSIFNAHGGYPVVFKTDSFALGDKVVYIPVDSLVPLDNPLFSFLSETVGKKYHRIRAKKLRGVFSMGMIVPAQSEWQVGDNVQERLGIQKWEPPIDGACMQSEQERDPGIIPMYTDLDSLRKYQNVLQEGEEVVITEKIHGANARYVFSLEALWVGSHKTFKKRDERNIWWRAAFIYDLETILAQYPDFALYGEIYGQVQDLRYETKPGQIKFAVFDVFDAKSGKYLDYDDCAKFCKAMSVPMVPVLYRGPWNADLRKLAEGKSTIAPSHVREGFVVRPVKERYANGIGRVILKLVGSDYLLRKE